MITNKRKDQLLRYCGVYYHAGCPLTQAMEAMQLTSQEEASLVCSLWGEDDIAKINEILETIEEK